MTSICCLNDLPLHSGVGRYAMTVKRLLEKEYNIDYYYLDYHARSLVLYDDKGWQTVARTKAIPFIDNKIWFWCRLRRKVPPGYDLYHFVNPNISFMVGKQPSVVTCEDLSAFYYQDFWAEKLWRRFLYSGLKRAGHIITISEWSKQDLIRLYGFPAERVSVTLLGVDTNVFRPRDKKKCREVLGLPRDGKIILNVATEKKRKNIPGLLEAFAMVCREVPQALLLRVGRPTSATKALIRKKQLSSKVRYFDDINEERLVSLYNAADVLAFPSFYEGFGLPVLEAMACGCPVVSSNASSLPEVVGEAGLLVDPHDIKAMAAALERVLYDRALKNNLIDSGLKWVKKFTWENTAEKTLAVYKKVFG